MTDTTIQARAGANERLALIALMLGNFVTGLAVLAPAGMISVLSPDLGVTIREAGFLMTAGAIILCIGSPVMAGLTTRIDRRTLLAGSLIFVAVGHIVSAFAPNYWFLLATRVVMLAVAAIFTPQAANAVGLIVEPQRRAASISFVFLGWSLAVAIGLPLMSLTTHYIGWREVHLAIGLCTFAIGIVIAYSLRPGILGEPLSSQSWLVVARDRHMMTLLLITALQVSGQFAILTYLDPLTRIRTGTGPEFVALLFATFGVGGFIGNVIATKLVDSLGALRTSVVFLASLLFGILLWASGLPHLSLLVTSAAFWGLGFAAFNSMQQARLVAAAPHLSSATVALNTSALYVGQAVGSGLGGLLFARGQFDGLAYTAVAFVVSAMILIVFTRSKP